MKKFLYILIPALVFMSCQKEADIELPDVKKKLSVSCFISDDIDTIKAVIFWSRPVFSPAPDEMYSFARDCDVRISDGVTEKNLVYNSATEQYELPVSEFPLAAGGAYTLTCRGPGGEYLTASTGIPGVMPEVISSTYQEETYTTNWGEERTVATFKTYLRDVTPEKEYYRFVYYQHYSPDGIFDFLSYLDESFIDDDAARDGMLYAEDQYEVYSVSSEENKRAYIIVSGEDYHRYHETLYGQMGNNPFAEPSIIYSNVENGLGCFAGYRKLEWVY